MSVLGGESARRVYDFSVCVGWGVLGVEELNIPGNKGCPSPLSPAARAAKLTS